jgi:LacI family transcriptional regulator
MYDSFAHLFSSFAQRSRYMSEMTPPLSRVAVVLDRAQDYSRDVLRGIGAYVRSQPTWLLHLDQPQYLNLDVLRSWRPDGIIASLAAAGAAGLVSDIGCPVVDVDVAGIVLSPRVAPDNHAIGRTAARHLLDCALRHFAFAGRPTQTSSRLRLEGFETALAAEGIILPPDARFHQPPDLSGDHLTQSWTVDRRVHDWVQQLPKPVGVFAFKDYWAVQLLEVCRQLSLRVPDDVAIVGVGNSDLMCELTTPQLSSVPLPGERVGFESAALLNRLIGGEPPPARPLLLPPPPVVVRQSTDLVAIHDPEIAAALRFIARSAHQPIGVSDVLRHAPMARRKLEREFQRLIGRSPAEEIRRVRIELAKRLLVDTDLTIAQVASRTGFVLARTFSEVFHQEVGHKPSLYRRQYRLPGVY